MTLPLTFTVPTPLPSGRVDPPTASLATVILGERYGTVDALRRIANVLGDADEAAHIRRAAILVDRGQEGFAIRYLRLLAMQILRARRATVSGPFASALSNVFRAERQRADAEALLSALAVLRAARVRADWTRTTAGEVDPDERHAYSYIGRVAPGSDDWTGVYVHAHRTMRGHAWVEADIAGKARRLPDEANPLVACACGCGSRFRQYDDARRRRRFIQGHNAAERNRLVAARRTA